MSETHPTPHDALHGSFFARHPDEAAHVLEGFTVAEALELVQHADAARLAPVLAHMVPGPAAEVLTALPPERTAAVLAAMPARAAATLLRHLGEEARPALLDALPAMQRGEVEAYLGYDPEAVGSLMNGRPLALPADYTVADTVRYLQRRATSAHDVPAAAGEVYVTDRQQALQGWVSFRALLLSDPEAPLTAVMGPCAATVHPMANREEVVELFREHAQPSIPVTNLDGVLLGVVHGDAIFHAGQEAATADLQTMVGVDKSERALSSVWFAVTRRLPWLQINLATAFLSAAVVGLFEDTIARFTALAVLLPVVAGQSGNSGAQSLAVTMRGLALRDVRPRQWLRLCWKEGRVAIINGVLVAATTCLAVLLWSGNPGLTAVIGMSMVLAMAAAGLAGTLIPVGLTVLNQDPAQSSSIFLTTVTDVVSFLSFLGLATVLAAWLV